MSQTKYLIIGSSHAGLSALEAIRMYDQEGPITIVSREKTLPYSPTVLPYVLSGQANPDRIFLRDQAYFDKNGATFLAGSAVVGVKPEENRVTLDSGDEIQYEKLLLATGSVPKVPDTPGLKDAPWHVLRTLEDALKIRANAKEGQSAIILGAGLIGMHAAQDLAKAGLQVTVVATTPQVMGQYFDDEAASLIERVFVDNGVKVITGSPVTHVTNSNSACAVSLENGLDLPAHLLLVAKGVNACMDYLDGSGVATGDGVLVDDKMRTSADNIWAAGDIAQGKNFFDSGKIMNGILPDASEQGRIAGMDMAEDPAVEPYAGGISMNTYNFFNNRAFAIGMCGTSGKLACLPCGLDNLEMDKMFSPSSMRYQKLVFQGDHLLGVASINTDIDPGVMLQIIRRKVDLGGVKERFASNPLDIGRLVMSSTWR
jgi:phenylglyoxylate dehydrogenase epsilon subunit